MSYPSLFPVMETVDPFTGVFGTIRGSNREDVPEDDAVFLEREIDIVEELFGRRPQPGTVLVRGRVGKSMLMVTMTHQLSKKGEKLVYFDSDMASPLQIVSRCPSMNMDVVTFITANAAMNTANVVEKLLSTGPGDYFVLDSLPSILTGTSQVLDTVKMLDSKAREMGKTLFICVNDRFPSVAEAIAHTIIEVDCTIALSNSHLLTATLSKNRFGRSDIQLRGEREFVSGKWLREES